MTTRSRMPPSFEAADALVEQLRLMLADLRADSQRRIDTLTRRVEGLEADAREVAQVLQATEHQAAQLTNLYVATYQLHASLEFDDVRRAIVEIAINLLGAERYVLLIHDEETGALEIASRSAGVKAPYEGLRYLGGDALVDEAMGTGVVQLGPVAGSPSLVAVPLAAHGAVLGTLVILSLLPQKGAVAVEDRELLDVMAAHAASALYASKIFHERTRKLRTLEGLMDLLKGPGGGGPAPR